MRITFSPSWICIRAPWQTFQQLWKLQYECVTVHQASTQNVSMTSVTNTWRRVYSSCLCTWSLTHWWKLAQRSYNTGFPTFHFQHQRITTAKLNTKVKNKRKIPAGLTLMSPQLWALASKWSPSRLPDHVFIKIKNSTASAAQGQETIFCGLQKVKAKPCVIGRSVYLFLPIITHTGAHKRGARFTSASL